jgi:hypothetical protein
MPSILQLACPAPTLVELIVRAAVICGRYHDPNRSFRIIKPR